MTEPILLPLSECSEKKCASWWSSRINAAYQGDARGSRRTAYIFVDVTKNAFSGTTIDLTQVVEWNPYPVPAEWGGHYLLMRTLKEERPANQGLLGLSFAEAVVGKPWPSAWQSNFLACLGTVVTFSRAHSPMYPRLGRDQVTQRAVLTWRKTGKLQKHERVALYPINRTG